MIYAATALVFICTETMYGPQGKWFPIGLATWLGKRQLSQQVLGNNPSK